jgi:hypothetical protein
MSDFDKLLESSLFNRQFGRQEEITHVERNKRARLEKALRVAHNKTISNSGMGERYEMFQRNEQAILREIAKYRPLSAYEKQRLNRTVALHESNQARLMASVLQKLDADPQLVPYNTSWSDTDILTQRFGLTPEEATALGSSKACKESKDGYGIDRGILKALSQGTRGAKKDVERARGDISDRNREEVGTYFEDTATEPIKPDKGEKLTDEELIRAMRLMVSAEYDAIRQYTELAENTDNELAKKILNDVADEERVHAGEFLRVLHELDPKETDFYADGAKEVESEINTEEI